MSRHKQLAITQRQFEVLTLLWEHGPMTVRELLERLPRERPLPYTTVLGLLQNMERAGLATHDVESQTHRYRALLSRQKATGTLLSDFVERFFCGSAERLVLGLVDAQKLSAADLREIEASLADKPDQASGGRPVPKKRRRKS
jgi:BlaI family transcriptional regulator, penicillinase repressor